MAEWTWISVGVGVCPSCSIRHGNTDTLSYWEGAGLPGEGATYCGAHCSCILFKNDVLESIADRAGIIYTTTDELLSGLGIRQPIIIMTQPQQIDLLNLGLDDIAEMDYETARQALIDEIRSREVIPNLDIMPLHDLIQIMETL